MTPSDGLLWLGYALLLVGGVAALLAATRAARRRPGPWGAVELALAGVALVWGSAAGGLGGLRLSTGQWGLAPGAEVPLGPAVIGTALGGVAAAAIALGTADREPLGLRAARGGDLALGAALVLPFLALSFGWASLLEALGRPYEEQSFVALLRDGAGEFVAVAAILYAVIAAPVLEELLFRGFALPPLVRWLGRAGGIAANGLLFGLMHAADPQAVPPLIALGAALAWLRLRSGSLLPSLLLHGLNNALVMAALLLDPTSG